MLALDTDCSIVPHTVSDIEPGRVVVETVRRSVDGVAGRRVAGVEDAKSVVGIEFVVIITSARHAIAVVVVLETLSGPAKTVRSQLKTYLTSRTRVFSGQTAVVVFFIFFA